MVDSEALESESFHEVQPLYFASAIGYRLQPNSEISLREISWRRERDSNSRRTSRPSTVFKTAALNHSAIPPRKSFVCRQPHLSCGNQQNHRNTNTAFDRSQKDLKRIQEFRIGELRILELQSKKFRINELGDCELSLQFPYSSIPEFLNSSIQDLTIFSLITRMVSA
jgi:hypothetical protein